MLEKLIQNYLNALFLSGIKFEAKEFFDLKIQFKGGQIMRIGIGGSAANPPHKGHLMLLAHLIQSGIFQRIIWLPSGRREDKQGFIASQHRANMTRLMLANLEETFSQTKIEVLFDDVLGENHPAIWWLEKFQKENPEDEIAWYTGVDSVVPEEEYSGKCEIETRWVRGEELMWNWKFIIISRKRFPDPRTLKLPAQFEIFAADLPDIRSSDIRNLILAGKPFGHLVVPEVEKYIKENGLYGYE